MARLHVDKCSLSGSCGNLGNRSGRSPNSINGPKAQSATWCIAGPTYECSPEKWRTCQGRRNASIKSYASGLASSSEVGGEDSRCQQ